MGLKIDIGDHLRNEKYYLEQDLVSILDNDSITYKQKVKTISAILKKIALIGSAYNLIEIYIKEDGEQSN